MSLNKTQISMSDIRFKDLLLSSNVYSAEKIQSFIDGVYAVKYELGEDGRIQSSKALDPLSVVVASENAFLDIKSQEKIDADALYLVEADNLNAYGKRITNVGYPAERTDAATVQYVLDNGKKIISEELKSIGNAEVDEVYGIKTTDHIPTTYLNSSIDQIGSNENASGIISFDVILSKIFKKTSMFSQIKLKDLTIVGPSALDGVPDEEKIEYRLVLKSKSATIESSNSVKLGKDLQILSFSFDEDIVVPSDKYTVTFESMTSSLPAKTAFRMQTINGLLSQQEKQMLSNKIPYMLSMSVVPVKAVDGILMKDKKHGATYCAEIYDGVLSVKRIIQ